MSSGFRPDMDTIRNIPIYSVGDRVIVRKWDQMGQDYGRDDIDISSPIYFVPGMRNICEEQATVFEAMPQTALWEGEMVDFQRIRMKFDNPDLDEFDDNYSLMNWFVEPVYRQQKKGLRKSLKNTIEGTGKFNERVI